MTNEIIPINAMICFSNVITKAKITIIVPITPVAFNKNIGIIENLSE